MKKKKPDSREFQDIELGPFPVDKINKALNLELEPADVIFKDHAQAHAFKRHPNEFDACLPHLQNAVLTPMYAGDDFENEGKIELVAKVMGLTGAGGGLLVAIAIEVGSDGFYHVCSMYPVSARKIENRRQAKMLVPVN